MPETAAFREWKAKDAIEWFHGIGRLVPLHNGYDSLAEGDLALIGSG